MTDRLVVRLSRLCFALPEVTERLSHGEPTSFVRGKGSVVTTADHHHDDRLAFWCAAPDGVQESLVASAPDRFFRPPYVGQRGWLDRWLDVSIDCNEIAALGEGAYRCVAPSRLGATVAEATAGALRLSNAR